MFNGTFSTNRPYRGINQHWLLEQFFYRKDALSDAQRNIKTRRALSTVHNSAETHQRHLKLQLIKRPVKHSHFQCWLGSHLTVRVWCGTSIIILTSPKHNPKATCSRLRPKSNGIFPGACATVPPNLAKTGREVLHNPVNRQKTDTVTSTALV